MKKRTTPASAPSLKMESDPAVASRSWACKAFALSLLSIGLMDGSFARGEEIVLLKIKNDLERPIEITIRSERPAEGAARAVVRRIAGGEQVKIRLKSPDKFLAEVRYGGSVYKSRPMPLRAALTRNPDQTLMISEVFMAAENLPPPEQAMLGLSLSPDEGSEPSPEIDSSQETDPAQEEVDAPDDEQMWEELNQQLAPSRSGRLRNRLQRGRALPRLRGR